MSTTYDWLTRAELREALEIERRAFEFPWSEDEFIRCLRQRNCIGIGAKVNGRIVGYMVYEIYEKRFHVLNFAVDVLHRRSGIGSGLLGTLIGKMSVQRRMRIMLECRESNTAAQLFFRSQGFKAVSILRDFYDDTVEDAYVFQYRLESPVVNECGGER